MGPQAATQSRDQDPGRAFERRLDLLASAIQQFRIDTQRFLAGDLQIPPDEQRLQIGNMLRHLRAANLKGVAENYRLNSLEAQFNSHCDLFARRLRKLELGAVRAQAEKDRLDPERGVVIDSRLEAAAVNALYKGLYLQKGQRNPTIDLERFRSMVSQQSEMIRRKTGCDKISFRVATEDGKLKLKARPIRSESG